MEILESVDSVDVLPPVPCLQSCRNVFCMLSLMFQNCYMVARLCDEYLISRGL